MSARGVPSLLVTVVVAAAFAGPVRGHEDAPGDRPKSGQTVILGTWTWDIEADTLGGKNTDVWWEIVTEDEKYLTPTNGTQLALVAGRSYDELKAADLKGAAYSTAKIGIGDLKPGTIVALRTKGGNLAKLKVVEYHDLHDLSFKEARYLDEGRKAFLKSRPNIKDYHIELRWELFEK